MTTEQHTASDPVVDGLSAEGVSVAISGLKILTDVSIEVRPGEIVGLIGPNGAGKTTMLNVLSGFQRPTAGSVSFRGRFMGRRRPRAFSRAGVARTFQAARLFPRLTVRENIEAAAVGNGLGRRAAGAKADALLEGSRLRDKAGIRAESLAYGEERWLSVLRALASDPVVILLDEPAAGLNDHETRELADEVRTLPDRVGCGVLLVEHNMPMVMSLCERLHVLDYGRTIATGTPEEIRRHPEVLRAYLGREAGGSHAQD